MLYCLFFGADIPQLSSAPTLNSNTSSIMTSWSPTQFAPISYRISYSCQLICGSSVTNQTVTVDRTSTTHILSATSGSSCSVSVMAVFGTSILSNTVTSSTNTTSAGMYDSWQYLVCVCVNLLSSYWCSQRAQYHISGEQVTECSVGDSTLPTPERTHHWIQTALW